MRVLFHKQLERLINRCADGQASAQKQLYDTYSSKMFGVCLRYMKNREDAEDVLQDGFVKVFRKISTFNNTGSFEGWMRTIFVNTALRQIEKNKRSENEINLPNLPEISAPLTALHQLTYKELIALVEELPTGYRLVFNLYVIEGYSHKEIADKLKISEGTSKSQLARAKNYLKHQVIDLYGLDWDKEGLIVG